MKDNLKTKVQVLEVQGYGLGEFCKAVQNAVDQGYRFDLDSNENYPTSFGAFMRAIMLKVDTNESTPVSQPEVQATLDTEDIQDIIEDSVEEAIKEAAQKITRKGRKG